MAKPELDNDGIVVTCPNCSQRNRLRFERLHETVRCGQCKQALPVVASPLEVPTSQLFDALVSKSSVPVVVDYWAEWCGPCRAVAPEIAKVAARSAGRFVVVKVDTDALSDVGQRFGIRSIPTLAVFAKGREAGRTAGARPAADIEAFIAQAV